MTKDPYSYACLFLSALLWTAQGLAQTPQLGTPQRLPQQTLQPQTTPLTFQQLNASCSSDPKVRAMNELRSNQFAFMRVDPDRLDQLLKRAAAIVKNRYLEIAQPAHSLGRLVKPPFCGGPEGGGMIVPGSTIALNTHVSDTSQFPDFQNCFFIYESEVQPENSPIELTRVTGLMADVHMDLTFDETAVTRLASRFRQTGTPAARFDVDLLSEPYVLEARPNIPPPISFSQKAALPTYAANADLENLGDLGDLGVANTDENRLIIARRAIKARESGIFFAPSLREVAFRANDSFDPCGETQPFSIFLTNLEKVFDERCYTYGTAAPPLTLMPSSPSPPLVQERGDPHYGGQLRILFQKDVRSGKIIGVRAYSFGSDI